MVRAPGVVIGVRDAELSELLHRRLAQRADVSLLTAHHFDDILLPVVDGLVDCAVLDLELDGARGSRSVEVLRHACPWVELVVLSGDQRLDLGREVLRHRVFYYGIKPVPEAELLEGIDQALARRAERRPCDV